MGNLYDRADIYDLIESDARWEVCRRHWEKLLEGKEIHTMLDVSIGSGSVTLQLAELGIALSGSDLSEAMLANCKRKAKQRGLRLI